MKKTKLFVVVAAVFFCWGCGPVHSPELTCDDGDCDNTLSPLANQTGFYEAHRTSGHSETSTQVIGDVYVNQPPTASDITRGLVTFETSTSPRTVLQMELDLDVLEWYWEEDSVSIEVTAVQFTLTDSKTTTCCTNAIPDCETLCDETDVFGFITHRGNSVEVELTRDQNMVEVDITDILPESGPIQLEFSLQAVGSGYIYPAILLAD